MHEPPFVPNQPIQEVRRAPSAAPEHDRDRADAARRHSRYRNDGWSIVTVDGKRAAHAEAHIAVTDDGPVALTTA